jgi:hypothetical protein
LRSKAFKKPNSSARECGRVRLNASSLIKNDASIAYRAPQNGTARPFEPASILAASQPAGSFPDRDLGTGLLSERGRSRIKQIRSGCLFDFDHWEIAAITTG